MKTRSLTRSAIAMVWMTSKGLINTRENGRWRGLYAIYAEMHEERGKGYLRCFVVLYY